MGDRVVIKSVEFLYGHLWQIDLYNETKNEYYRTFIENEKLRDMMEETLLTHRPKELQENKK